MGWGKGRWEAKLSDSSIGSILSIKNERSCKNGGLKRIMFRPSHMHLRPYFCFIFSYTLFLFLFDMKQEFSPYFVIYMDLSLGFVTWICPNLN